MSFDKSQFFQVFYEETAEHLGTMEELLLGLDIGSPDQEDLNAIFRAVHSIKGGAGTFGFMEMTDVAHIFESVLDRVRKGTLKTTKDMVDLFLETGDVLNTVLASYKAEEPVNSELGSEVCKQLNVVLNTEAEAELPKPVLVEEALAETLEEDPGFGFFDDVPEPEIQTRPEEVVQAIVQEQEKDKADEKEQEQAQENRKQRYGFSGPIHATDQKGRRETDRMDLSLDASGEPLEVQAGRRDADRISISKKTARVEAASSLRIDIKKVDQLFNQVGEVVITQAMLALMASKLDPVLHENIHSGLAELERNTRELQESVMSIRMVPCRNVFSRFPRLIRDMQKKFNKEVALVLLGEETEVDKGFVEKLVDPLTHLVRNSFDHGIESAEDRLKSGKVEKATITLRASHQGGNVVIEVSDDGKGLNREKILHKAREKGIASSESMTDQEVWQLIFAPGLSTTEKVSDLSGRGVGMDVVKKNVQTMGGVVDIESVTGQGSRIIIRLPLTLAIIEGMVIRIGVETYILPLISIVESIRPGRADLSKILEKGELVNLRGEYVPVIRLSEILGISGEENDISQSVLVIVESEGGRVAIVVDELIGQQQVVIKSLEQNFMKVRGIAGATILGNGHVAFILDVRGLLKFSRRREVILG